MRKGGHLYIMTNAARRPVYIGVTSNLVFRVDRHRRGIGSAYCRRYNLTKLVYVEKYPTIVEAIAREKAMKAWKRAWKDELINKGNPQWRDLWDVINA